MRFLQRMETALASLLVGRCSLFLFLSFSFLSFFARDDNLNLCNSMSWHESRKVGSDQFRSDRSMESRNVGSFAKGVFMVSQRQLESSTTHHGQHSYDSSDSHSQVPVPRRTKDRPSPTVLPHRPLCCLR